MMNVLQISLIPGFMLGIEWQYDNRFLVIDLGIIRIVWDYWGIDEA